MLEPKSDPIVCYCFGIKRDQVRAHFAIPAARVEDLIVRTGITTKCTACALDLDVLLDEIRSAPRAPVARAGERTQAARGWADRVERADSGFLICGGSIATRLRLANYSPNFENKDLCAPHRYRLTLFANDGRVGGHLAGRIDADSETTIDLGSVHGCPAEGWFLLRQTSERPGCYGTLRPQVVLEGGTWIACYHTQFHRDATTSGRRASTPLRAIGNRTRVKISIINGSAAPASFQANLLGPGINRISEGNIPGNGHTMLDVDAAFAELPGDAPLTLRIESNRPTRKNLVNVHPDGALGVDHFPNMV